MLLAGIWGHSAGAWYPDEIQQAQAVLSRCVAYLNRGSYTQLALSRCAVYSAGMQWICSVYSLGAAGNPGRVFPVGYRFGLF